MDKQLKAKARLIQIYDTKQQNKIDYLQYKLERSFDV